jgi:hypothetical protein
LSFLALSCFSQPVPAEGKLKTGENKYNSPKSKSEKTAAPTVIKLTRQQLMNATSFSDLVESIPSSCTVFSCLLTINSASGTIELPHNGNTINPDLKSRFPDCQWIIVENLKSSCHRAHKANYKIIVY